MQIFDSHSHLNSSEFLGREEEVIQLAKEAGVAWINNAGVDLQTNDWALDLAVKFDNCYATIGWHPDEAGQFDYQAESYLEAHVKDKKVLAIGEIGLDYHWMVQSKEKQIEVFEKQIKLAKKANKPFQVHTREALSDTYQIIKKEGVGQAGAVMHSFSGTYEEAVKFEDLGMFLSFSGVVSFKKALDVQEAAKKLPLNSILVETDAPYLTPAPFRGRENQPAYTKYVVEKIAELKGISAEEVALATTENAKKLFKLSD